MEIWNSILLKLQILSIFAIVFGSDLDNEVVGEPEIRCAEDAITFTVRTKNPFR